MTTANHVHRVAHSDRLREAFGVVETAEKRRLSFLVVVHPRPAFAEYPQEPKRFSRYWEKVASQVPGDRPKSSKRPHQ